ncbi:glycerate kinase [Paracoccus sp. R86501]|uniref:glycerate kinase type-2 family protein n=1 Tax=Paracoccus sp. R86501 TaxID=3101711 RepID=UPI00366FB377
MELLQLGVRAADPRAAVDRALPDLADGGKGWHIVAVGKAARAMTQAALAHLPGAPALVITNRGNDMPLAGATVLRAGHPQPDQDGLSAARQLEEFLSAIGPDDRVLALISGGGSAMLPAPVEGLDLADLQAVNAALLSSGADITRTNLVRQSLDRLKGGGWLRLTPAPVAALILSDVPDDDLRVVASGPTVAPIGTPALARQAMQQLGIWDGLPVRVHDALDRAEVTRDTPAARNILVGSNGISLQAMLDAGGQDGGAALTGDVEECALTLLHAVQDAPIGVPLVFGGETTVRLTGKGMGGRNQELALRFARHARDLPGNWCFAAMGTDGRDGPGDAAGGIVGHRTLSALRDDGIDLDDVLRRNDATPALRAVGGLIMTGPSGTNVADLAVFVRYA